MSGFGPSNVLETRLRGRARWGILALLVLAGAAALPAQEARPQKVAELLDRLEAAYRTRDVAAALALYDLADDDARRLETETLQTIFGAEEVELSLQRPSQVPADVVRVVVSAQLFRAMEPRARVDQVRLVLEWKDGAWAITGREELGNIDGLVHLSLDPRGFKAAGLTVRQEDFELYLRSGTLFSSPPNLGPTLLVFVGQAEVKISPGPAAEREQLRRFSGATELRDQVRTAFIRLHPADLHRMLEPARFDPDPESEKRLPEAQRVYREHSQRYFILDSPLPRAPWWLLPGVGDASITFDTRHNGELTFTTSSSEAEDLSLFDRSKRRQICLYPSGGREPRYTEDAGRAYDFTHLDLQARFEPARRFLSAEARLTLRLLQPATTIRLRLDDDFRVESVTSGGNLRHLFFRVRGQDSLMVSLGSLSPGQEEVTLTVRYSGVHEPAPVENEVLQLPSGIETHDDNLQIEKVLVYTNRTAWYPRPALDDHATARLRLDVPVGQSAVTGGVRTSARVEGQRTVVEYDQNRPGKYVTVAVARFYEAGERAQDGLRLRGFGITRTRDEVGDLLDRAQRILAFYTREFGPCPYPDLNFALIEGETPGGHAPPGMVLLQRRPLLMRRTLRDDPASFPDEPDFFLAHELAHQWFGHGVSGANYRERWLSEGFAQYAAALWARERGETAFRNVLLRFARWAFRYDDEGPIHLGYRVGHLESDAQAYRAIVYDKAAYVLHMLRGVTGDEPFRRGLLAYQEEHRYGKAGTDDLREALEAASGQDLAAYFKNWVFGTGLPRLTYRSRIEGAATGYRVALEVEAAGLPAAVPAQVTLTPEHGEAVAKTVTVAPGTNRLQIDSALRPRRVELNANRGLLARIDGK